MPASTARADVDFDRLSGSDLLSGVGPRAIGLGGAFTAIADEGSAVYWNPAGLAGLPKNTVFVSGNYPSEFGAAGIVVKPHRHLALGITHINRLRFDGDSGAGDWSGYPSHLLDLTMIDVEASFSGRIDSKTTDLRLSIAFKFPFFTKLAVGANLIRVE